MDIASSSFWNRRAPVIVGVAVAALCAVAISSLYIVAAYDAHRELLNLPAVVRRHACSAHVNLEDGLAGRRALDFDADVRREVVAAAGAVDAAAGPGAPDWTAVDDVRLRRDLDGVA